MINYRNSESEKHAVHVEPMVPSEGPMLFHEFLLGTTYTYYRPVPGMFVWGTNNPVVLKEVRTNLMLTGGLVHVEGSAMPLVTQMWPM